MPTITVTRTYQVEVPEGATHYRGDILDDPTWFKRTKNDTGTFDGWSMWKDGDWYLEQWWPEPAPNFVMAIGAVPTVIHGSGNACLTPKAEW